MHEKLVSLFRMLFLASILVAAAFISCLTAMRFAIRGSEVVVPNLIGKTLSEGTQAAGASELQLKVDSRRFDDQVAADRIISQSPSPNSKLKRDRSVRVIISLGAKKIPVPDLEGESFRASHYTLLTRGLTPGLISVIDSENAGRDIVISQSPPPQSTDSPLVNLLISSGKPLRAYLMPNLEGTALEEASGQLRELGLELGTIRYQSVPGLARGTILRHDPAPGFKLVEGSSVQFEVCQ